MKIELNDVSETQKTLAIEIPTEVVESEIERVARTYSRSARIPGFRPGKAPAAVVRKRFREQILSDVAHDLIPGTIDRALRERGLEPVETPSVKDLTLVEGAPLTFKATFETAPAVDPGDLSSVSLRQPPIAIRDDAVEEAIDRLRERAARFEPVEGRGLGAGDFMVVDLVRRRLDGPDGQPAAPETHENVTIEQGAAINPPGFDAHVLGQQPGETRHFVVTFPSDYEVAEMAGAEVDYTVTLKSLRVKHVPPLDDEFAKDVGDFDSVAALRDRVREDLAIQAQRARRQEMRNDALRQLAARVPGEVPTAMVEREIDRRADELVRRLVEQRIDPREAAIDWDEFRHEQRQPAVETVRGILVLDELARREGITVSEEELADEVDRYAAASGRPAEEVRRKLEREGGLGRLVTGMRREKALQVVMDRATIVPV